MVGRPVAAAGRAGDDATYQLPHDGEVGGAFVFGLDASLSSDADGDDLTILWYEGDDLIEDPANIEKEELSEEAKKAAFEVFEKDCLIHLGTCIAPTGKAKQNSVVLTAELTLTNGNKETHEIHFGDILRIEVPYEQVNAKLAPGKGLDIGAGKNELIETSIYGGVVGIIFDGRGRPLEISKDSKQRINDLKKWSDAVNEYPDLKE